MKSAVLAVLMLFGAICTQAQWYQQGGGEGTEITGLEAGNFASAVNPDCNSGICFPQWDQEITFPSVTVNSGWCGRVVDTPSTYALNFCIEATKQSNGLWNTNARVVYRNLSNGSYTELFNVLIYQNQSSPAGQRVWFSENYYNTQYVRYDFKYAPVNTTNWSAVHSWYELRNSQNPFSDPTTVGHLVYSPGTCVLTTVHIDGWTTYETPGRTSPNLLDSDLTNAECLGVHGKICDTDECASNGQTLFQNQ